MLKKKMLKVKTKKILQNFKEKNQSNHIKHQSILIKTFFAETVNYLSAMLECVPLVPESINNALTEENYKTGEQKDLDTDEENISSLQERLDKLRNPDYDYD